MHEICGCLREKLHNKWAPGNCLSECLSDCQPSNHPKLGLFTTSANIESFNSHQISPAKQLHSDSKNP